MGKKYIPVRFPSDAYVFAKRMQTKMQTDVSQICGKPIAIPMTKVLRAVFSPEYNKNFIEINVQDLVKLAKEKKR